MQAIFLDRDGVICDNRPDHVKNWDEFVFLTQAHDALVRLAMLDFPIIVITNQASINRGTIAVETLKDIHRRMVAEVKEAGGRIDRIYYCPHRPDEDCHCRKPRPGMLQRAANDMGIDLARSYLIGDAWSDIEAGLTVNCTPFLVLTGRGLRQAPQALREAPGRFRVVRDLLEAAAAIQQIEKRIRHQATRYLFDDRLVAPTVTLF